MLGSRHLVYTGVGTQNYTKNQVDVRKDGPKGHSE